MSNSTQYKSEQSALIGPHSSHRVRRNEVLELIGNYLLCSDYLNPLELLQKRSLLPLNQTVGAQQLRESILSGEWDAACSQLSSLVDSKLSSHTRTQLLKDLLFCLVHEQHYLELIDADKVQEAVTILRTRLAPFQSSPISVPRNISTLCKLLIEMDKEKWHKDLGWSADHRQSRLQLFNHIRLLIHTFINPDCVSPNRLSDLLDLGMQQQVVKSPLTHFNQTAYTSHVKDVKQHFPSQLLHTYKQYEFFMCSFSPNGKYLAALGHPLLMKEDGLTTSKSCVLLLFKSSCKESTKSFQTTIESPPSPTGMNWVQEPPITLWDFTMPPLPQLQMEWRCDDERLYVLSARQVYSIIIRSHAVYHFHRPYHDLHQPEAVKLVHPLAGTDCLIFTCDNVPCRVLNSRFQSVHLSGDKSFRAHLMASHIFTGDSFSKTADHCPVGNVDASPMENVSTTSLNNSSVIRVYIVDFLRRIRVMSWTLNKVLTDNITQRLLQPDLFVFAKDGDKKPRSDEEEMDVTELVGSLTSTDSGEDNYEEQSESDEHNEDSRLSFLRYSTARGSQGTSITVHSSSPQDTSLSTSNSTSISGGSRLFFSSRRQPIQRVLPSDSPIIIGSYSTVPTPAAAQSEENSNSSTRSESERAYIRRLLQAAWHVENLLTGSRGGTLWTYDNRSSGSSSGESSSTTGVPSWFLEPAVLSVSGSSSSSRADTVTPSTPSGGIHLTFAIPPTTETSNTSLSDTLISMSSSGAHASSPSTSSSVNAEHSLSSTTFASSEQSSASVEVRESHNTDEEAIVSRSCFEEPDMPYGFIRAPKEILDLQCSRDGRRLITLHHMCIRVWNAFNGNLIRDLHPSTRHSTTRFAKQRLNICGKKSEFVSAVTQDQRVLFWRLDESLPVYELELIDESDEDVSSVSSSPTTQPSLFSPGKECSTSFQTVWNPIDPSIMAVITSDHALQLWTSQASMRCKSVPEEKKKRPYIDCFSPSYSFHRGKRARVNE